MSADRATEPRDPFPPSTLEVLELQGVLEWIAEQAATPAGKADLLDRRPGEEAALQELRAGLGREALEARLAREAPRTVPCADLLALSDRARSRVLEGEDFAALMDVLALISDLRRWGVQHPQYALLSGETGSFPDLGALESELRASFDVRGRVLDEADPALGPVRERIRGLQKEREVALHRVADELAGKNALQQRKPVQRGDRTLLAVRATHQGRAPGVLHDRSQSGDTVFIEPSEVVAVSNRLADQKARERQIVQRVLGAWTARLARMRETLEEVSCRLGGIDAALAAAAWAEDVEALWPEMPDRPCIDLRGARHPLLVRQLGREAVVPLDLQLGMDFDLLVVTGPNTGGKTVCLKTVGLLALLACCALPIPAAAGSRIARLPGLDADIGDQQSLENSLSTFSGHLKRILRVLSRIPAGGLVLLDELGTGTDPDEGAALGQAVLEALLERGALVLADTHLGSLKIFSTRVARAENASMEFDPETLAPRYRLLVGVPGASHALEVAERLGLRGAVLRRARELVRHDGERAEDLIAEVAEVRRDAELLREKARGSEQEAREHAQRIAEREAEAARRQELREREAASAFESLQADVLQALEEESRRLAGRLRPAERASLDALVGRVEGLLAGHELGDRWREFVQRLRKGTEVWVPRYRERMTVLKVDRRKEKVRLRHANLEIELPLREISWSSPPPGTGTRA